MTIKKRFLQVVIIIVLLSLASSPAFAGDKSFSTVVNHIKSNYNGKQQSFFGMMMFARMAVKMIKPAGVKNFKVVLLRELDYTRGPRPGQSEFHSVIRSKIESVWSPLVQFSSPREKQWTYVYALHEKEDIKILVVTMQKSEAFVVQAKFSPAKLIEFMNDPKIMGISLKHEEKPKDYQEATDEGEVDEDENNEHPAPPAKAKPPNPDGFGRMK
ncbi:MAG TPA: hypothetical protein VJX74_10810 [Blastocatellia bacterium]|nr:hypothetical protein [Blastocatellia bacterium]